MITVDGSAETVAAVDWKRKALVTKTPPAKDSLEVKRSGTISNPQDNQS